MKGKDVLIVAGAALAVFLIVRSATARAGQTSDYWAVKQGNTGYPPEAYTGIPAAGGGVWV